VRFAAACVRPSRLRFDIPDPDRTRNCAGDGGQVGAGSEHRGRGPAACQAGWLDAGNAALSLSTSA